MSAYNEFYGFSEDPFRLNPDPKFLYLARSHWEALSAMMDAIKERKGIAVVTGEAGIGKTILVYALLKDLQDNIKTAFVFDPRYDSRGLLEAILDDLEADPARKETDLFSLVVRFRKYLNERYRRNETVAVIIDEAQSLDGEVLENLGGICNPDDPAAKILQILLIGPPELETKLNSAKIKRIPKNIGVRCRLQPLTREEGRKYMKYRLKQVGKDVSEVFTAKAVHQVWEFAGGIPRIMNAVCDRALFIGCRISSPIVDSKIVAKAVRDLSHLHRKPKAVRPGISSAGWKGNKTFRILLLAASAVFFLFSFSRVLSYLLGK